MPRVAVLGNLALDRVDGGPPRPGGGPFHAARALRTLDRTALVVARCAASDRALLQPPLVRLGVPVLWRTGAATARFAIDYDAAGDRRMVVEEVASPWLPADVQLGPELARVAWLHVAPLARSDVPAETLAILVRRCRLSFDGQGLVRPARTGPLELDADYDPDLLRFVSILKLAEEEARVLVGDPTERALRSLGVREVVVTRGSYPAIVLADGVAADIPVRPVEGRVDPTGAGDAFAASYLVSRSSGLAPAAAARRAAAVVAALLSGRRR